PSPRHRIFVQEFNVKFPSPIRFILGLVCAASLLVCDAALAQKMRVAYWTRGVSLGFGSVLEDGKFLEKEGLDVEFVKFGDVNAPTNAESSGTASARRRRTPPEATIPESG